MRWLDTFVLVRSLLMRGSRQKRRDLNTHSATRELPCYLDARMADLERTLLNVVLCGIIRGQWGRYNVREQDGQTDGYFLET